MVHDYPHGERHGAAGRPRRSARDHVRSGHRQTPDGGSDDNNVQPNVSKLTIGAYSSGGEDSIADASFADFNLFGVVLTQSQITALYQGTVGALPAASPVQIGSAGVLDLGGYSQTVASLSDITLGSGGLVTNSVGGPVTLTLALLAGAVTFSGVIQNGAGQTSPTVNGVGTQVLAGSNTYTGVTTIASGTCRSARRRHRLDRQQQRRAGQRHLGL